MKNINEVKTSVELQTLMSMSLNEWKSILTKEVNVYVLESSSNKSFLARCYNSINFVSCAKDTATQIVTDNLYYLLTYKYFKKATGDECEEKITSIVKSCTSNLNRFLTHVAIDSSKENIDNVLKKLPTSCIAFKNGIFDFKTGKWLFKYNKTYNSVTKDILIEYPTQFNDYVVYWYLNIDFEPLFEEGTGLTHEMLKDFLQFCKNICKNKDTENKCFELVYNMSHDINNIFSFEKFTQLCEIMGFTVYQDFLQHFIMLVGSGSNGKNSLFEGCFANSRLIPNAAKNSITDLENDKFASGNLSEVSHNFCFENRGQTYDDLTKLKDLTGSEFQQIEQKGKDKRTIRMNVKFLFSTNDLEDIKFKKVDAALVRRIEICELFWTYDKAKHYMLLNSDYYDTSFSQNNIELINDELNTIMYCYLAMFGIANATENWTKDFEFTINDYQSKYKENNETINQITDSMKYDNLYNAMTIFGKFNKQYEFNNTLRLEDSRLLFSSEIWTSSSEYGKGMNNDYTSKLSFLSLYSKTKVDISTEGNEIAALNDFVKYWNSNNMWLSFDTLKEMCKQPTLNLASFKKMFPNAVVQRFTNNKPFVKTKLMNYDKIIFVR